MSVARLSVAAALLLLTACAGPAGPPDPATAEAALQEAVAATTTAVAARRPASTAAPTSAPVPATPSLRVTSAPATVRPAAPSSPTATSPLATARTTTTPAAARPLPSGTPGTGLTLEEATYTRGLLRVIEEYDRSFDRFRQLVEQAKPEDDAWRLGLRAELTFWANGAAAAREIQQSPPAFREVHRRVISGLELYGKAAREIAQAMETGDNDLLGQGMESVGQARRAFVEAQGELSRLARERGL